MAAADDWSFAKHIRSRGEAIRQLVALGAPVNSIMGDVSFAPIIHQPFKPR